MLKHGSAGGRARAKSLSSERRKEIAKLAAIIRWKNRVPKPKSKPEELFALHLRLNKIPHFVREYQFAPPRKWRVDFAYPEKAIAVEIEGGIHNRGRHVRADGFEKDCEKYNALAAKGWRLFRYTPQMVKDGRAIDQICEVLKQ